MKTSSGADAQALCMGGGGSGYFGTATAVTATTLTPTGTPWVANQWIGHLVVVSSGVYGVVVSNATNSLTIDRWYNAATPGGAAGTTPTGTPTFTILPGGAPFPFIALTANNTAPASGDTTLAGEITTAGGGLIRQLATYAHTSGVAGYTCTGTYTANSSDVPTLPVTIAKIGVFTSLVNGQMVFETLLSSTATLSANGDQLTVTSSISL